MSARAIAAAAAATLCLGAGAGTALAHTEVVASSPRDGASLSRLPAAVILTFEEPVGRVRGVVVRREGGPNLVRRARTHPRDAARVVATLKRPGRRWQPGSYRAGWRVVGEDGHTVGGVLRFRVTR